jgi:hypothetical protein
MDRSVSLRKRAFEGLAQFLVTLGAMLFLSAWSWRYLQGWIFWLEFSVLVTLITIYFLKSNPALIERRLKAGPGAEKERWPRHSPVPSALRGHSPRSASSLVGQACILSLLSKG